MATRKVWRKAPRISKEATDRLAPFSPLAAQLLHNRGLTDAADGQAFLARDESLLHDPRLLPNMDRAIARLHRAIQDGETIGIFGDFDADGVTGTALLALGLDALGVRAKPYLPHRVDEGHGLNSQAIESLHGLGVTLLVTVDCGVTSPAEVAQAAELGMDTIITDHHVPTSRLPEALAIVNPQLEGSSYPFPHLAGVGLAFKLVQGLYGHMGLKWDQSLLQLAALGTVTDVVPLRGENRYIVASGLSSLSTDPMPGLRELLRLGGMGDLDSLDTDSIGFVLGPRINAPGRLEHAMTSYRLLMSRSQEEAAPLARDMDRLNRERQGLTQQALDASSKQLGIADPTELLILLWSEDYSPGIVGLVASRLVEQYYRPAVVVALDGDEARGSGRSIPEFDLASALSECGDLFTRFGGHRQAGGFLMGRDDLPTLKERLLAIARRELAHLPLEPALNIDAHVRISSVVGANFQFLQDLAPYGADNPRPVFLTKEVNVVNAQRMGTQGQHMRFKLRHEGATWDAVAFGQADAWQDGWDTLDVVYTLGVDNWRGTKTFKLYVQDFRPTGDGLRAE